MRALPFSSIRKYVIIAAFLLLAGGIGYTLGQRNIRVSVLESKVVVQRDPPAGTSVDFSLFWDVWGRLFRYYIDKSSLDSQKMVWGAITGMVGALGDPYTAFLPPKENKEFKEDLGGEFEGIGAQLGMKDNRIIVIAPLKGTPADKAGIRPSDWIVKVNDEETNGWNVPQAVTKIRGPHGTKVTLTILHEHDQKPIEIAIVRDTILVPSVESWQKSINAITEISNASEAASFRSNTEKIAYLRLSRFGDHTNEDWNKAVSDLLTAQKTNGNLKGLVFDLRNNPGGYLEGSVFIASEFLGSGIVVSQVNSDGSKQEYAVNRKGKLLDIPLVVLVNKGSASAAEIVAGALRNHKRAKLVGESTFGKGSVQTPQELSGGAGLHITTGKWLTPNGDFIQKQGIKPDVEISLDVYEASSDGQLAKAIELLLQ
ncbi:S41 family peptidase [Candidatus Gottesmanbacteria bacterium]|nr:S41 family peptidase [Candidatus Gottesmanbacteria bacterium]